MLTTRDNAYEPSLNSKEWLNNRGVYYLEAKSKSPNFNPCDCVPTAQTGSSATVTYGIRRLGVTKFTYDNLIPTIVEKNRYVDFTVNGTPFVAILDIGFYNVPSYGVNSFLDELIAAMTAASGVVFTVVPIAPRAYQSEYGGGMFYNIQVAAGNTYAFTKTRRMERLEPVFGPNFDTVESQNKIVGPLLLLQTRFFDVRSGSLTEDQKIPAYSNLYGSSDTIFRVYTETIYNEQDRLQFGPPPQGKWSGSRIVVNAPNPRWINRDPTKTISNIDIRLVDEFGEILETMPPISDQNGYPFSYSIEILLECS